MSDKTPTTTLASAMHVLAKGVKIPPVIANESIRQAADRLTEQHSRILELETLINDIKQWDVNNFAATKGIFNLPHSIRSRMQAALDVALHDKDITGEWAEIGHDKDTL